MKTYHASPERDNREIIKRQFNTLNSISHLKEMINALPNVITILNDKRQVVFSNNVLINQLNITDLETFLGKRPGEILNCTNADCESGCGTSEKCRVCGAVNSILLSLMENRKVVDECRINAMVNGQEESFDYEVTAAPFTHGDEKFIIFSVTDISGEKRKKILERIFFHDILNTAGNVMGLSDLIQNTEDNKEKSKLLKLMNKVSTELVDEIEAQKQLVSAEDGELKVKKERVNSHKILEHAVSQFSKEATNHLNLKIENNCVPAEFTTDKSLLTRIIKNMLKNAIEASPADEPVIAGIQVLDHTIRFYVHNNTVILPEVKLQIFNRSFSTKGSDRGLGTYSMKLLGERYLKGKVSFESSEEKGTRFCFDHPNN